MKSDNTKREIFEGLGGKKHHLNNFLQHVCLPSLKLTTKRRLDKKANSQTQISCEQTIHVQVQTVSRWVGLYLEKKTSTLHP